MSLAKFICNLCKKDFKQKSDYTKHINKKSPCVSIQEIQNLTQSITINNDNKTKLTTIFKYCLNVLRDNEHLIGDKSLRTLAHLLDLRLLEPQIGNTINLDTYEYNFDHIEDENKGRHKDKLLSIVRFSNLAKETSDNIPIIMKFLWDDILSVHPKTKNIFIKNKGFDINNASTYKKIIDKLMSFNFSSIENDILGAAYEEVIKDIMTGKVLGQHFTPISVKQMMVNLIDPQVKPDGTIETIFDPAMGTGGLLITCLRNLIVKAQKQNVNLDWEFIRNNGLSGREAEPDTYQLCISNMLISSGYVFDVLEKGDSIRDPITNKYDIIIANPPFGIDGLIYTEIIHPLRNEYMPISSNSAVPLFLQAIIHMLKVNGRCAVVLPEGQELFSKSKALVAVREYLMKTCDLKEVIYLPAGTFTHTSIKTCVFYFHKKKEGKDVLETKLKHSKTTQKETERLYVFSKTHQTHKVKFYDYNTENDTKHLLLEVAIDDLAKNNYSLNYAEYLKDETADEVYEDGVVVKTLGEVCEFLNGKKRKADEAVSDGQYKFITCSIQGCSYLNEYDFEEKALVINSINGSGRCMIYCVEKYSTTTNNFHFKIKNKKDILTEYIYYYLYHNIKLLEDGFLGSNQKKISKDYLSAIKIPIPPLDRQQEIVKYLDFIYEKCIKTSNEKILELKQLNEFCLSTQKVFGENSVKMLGEVCDIDIKVKKHSTEYGKSNGKYKFHTGGVRTDLYVDEYDIEELYIIQNRTNGSGKCNLFLDKKFSLAKQTMAYIAKNKNEITTKYIYYYLKANISILEKGFIGANHKNISHEYLENIKILIPSLERQKEIVDYCDFNDTLIQQLEKEIEQNKKQAHLFISGIVKTTGVVASIENTNTGTTLNDILNSSVNEEQEDNSGITLNDVLNTSDNEEQEEVIEAPVIKQLKQPKQKKTIII